MVIFKSLNKDLLSKHMNNVFIETGSQYGHGIDVALKCGFEQVHSIDIDSKYHGHCSQRFPQELEEGRLKLYIGDSAVQLAKILENINEPVTFWLDAHADAGIIGKAKCPVMFELEQIKEHHIKTHTILIDDRRMFGKYWGVGTNEKDVIDLLMQINPEYQISYANGCEPKDVIVAQVSNV